LVKGGGTFVIPVVEKADVLSLEVMSIEMPRASLPAADGRAIEVECRAQVKINGDDRSIVAAVEHFLTKSQNEIKDIIRPVLEKHLAKALRNLNGAEAARNPAEVAAEVLNAASADLASMGMSIISFTIRTARVV
jgi:flotillin